ncbi:uncharacterized protein [Chelonus insularis]|uniref:uncharacterized protein isoform X1 n=1 Tax=Chelonus insularis TaxID=460826 RepID=UPI00158D103C|nr:uncharacterized protein LOC118074499 isoform X1 [Chelonus insularis]
MSENPIISNPEEGENFSLTSASPTVLPNKSPNVERCRSTDKKLEQNCKDSSEFSKNVQKDANLLTPRRSSQEFDEINDSTTLEDSNTPRASPCCRRKSGQEEILDKILNTVPSEVKLDDEKISPKSPEDTSIIINEKCLEQEQTSSIISDNRSEVDDSEVGIVGPATAAENVLNDEELLDPSKDEIRDNPVTEWIERSSLHKSKNILKDISIQQQQSTRKSQRIVTSIIKRSIKCLNKMHAMDCGTTTPGNGKDMDKKKDDAGDSPKVPQNRQNGAALPEETATATSATTGGRVKIERLAAGGPVKKENHSDDDEDYIEVKKKSRTAGKEARKRRSVEETFSTNGNPKRTCFEQRERFIDSLVGCERISAEELATRAEELRAEVQALDELARAKEMEWNEILSMRKLKEEAYLRVERKRQVMGFLESNNGQMSDSLPPASLSLVPEWEESRQDMSQDRTRNTQESANNPENIHEERMTTRSRLEVLRENLHATEDDTVSIVTKSDNEIANLSQKSQRSTSGSSSKPGGESGRKLRRSIEQHLDNRQIGEGRQGPIVDVKSIIADHRLRHPETVPRRGRRMRNSVNVHLGTGGAMVETGHGDSRPSSTDSCKSNSNIGDQNPMSFKDVLVQFAKLSQQQGEPMKTPQNYPDVTLHPVAPSAVSINSNASSQQTGSLLHGILTKNQSPRPTTFSPTLARLLTAPERERNSSSSTTIGQQGSQSQHLIQAYQGSNPVSISDLLSSSKARTEITITPVVNPQIQSAHPNNVVHVDDVEEENSLAEERDSRRGSSARDNREDRDTPPRCQGCHERAAQFVCAGCGNQWYCSRECQVSAWDEHSEVCSG